VGSAIVVEKNTVDAYIPVEDMVDIVEILVA
jgi:hypothetical protein